MEQSSLNYAKLWKTLMRIGIKQRFSQIRSEFFMRIAEDGPRLYSGEDDIEDIVKNSFGFRVCPEMRGYLDKGISNEDKFKHHAYRTDDGELYIEYFANTTRGIPKEFVDFCAESDNNEISDYDVDGYCLSYCVDLEKIPEEVSGEPATSMDIENRLVTVHFILIGEASESITPDTYPGVIKHELTHACLYEVRKNFRSGYYKTLRVPAMWTDDEIVEWDNDLNELCTFMESDSEDARTFREFISEFLMYESDGQTKEKNPIKESRVPKSTNPNAKSKVTYRTLTPFDRFEENLEIYHDTIREKYQPILEALRSEYDDYDKFLDEVRM